MLLSKNDSIDDSRLIHEIDNSKKATFSGSDATDLHFFEPACDDQDVPEMKALKELANSSAKNVNNELFTVFTEK